MTHALNRQKYSNKKQKLTEKSMMNLELPRINNKVEEANAFLANPLQLSKASQREDQRQEGVNVVHEPWMDNGDDSDVTRKEKAIKLQIASLLGTHETTQDGQVKTVQDASEISPEKIISKMKKYQPINSSFSLIYGEMKTIEERNTKCEAVSDAKRRKILNLPALNLRGQSTNSKAELQMRLQDLYSLRQSKTPSKPQKFTSYINKIKEIYREGNALHHKSQTLIHRIDKVSEFLQHKFDKFDEQSENMLADVGTYHLEQQTSGEYKKSLMESLSQRIRR